MAIGHTRGSEEGGTKANSERVADYARMQLTIYCLILRRLHERNRRRGNVHGVHG